MPEALPAQRRLMATWFPRNRFGDSNTEGIDDGPPYAFLISRGYTEDAGFWHKPTPSHTPTNEEVECLLFLRNEWDYDFVDPLFTPLPHKAFEDPSDAH